MEKLSLMRRQADVVDAMLNLNSADRQADWKFLIYDTIADDILAPQYTGQTLKMDHNVTLRLPIHADRDPVPDVSAIYFVMPTEDNVKRICNDLTDHLYDSYYLNFISPLSQAQLSAIAQTALESDSADDVKKIYDQHLNFIALEDNLFVLRENDKQAVSYYAINRADASDEEIGLAIDAIVDGLISVFVTLSIIPIIRCPKGGAAEAVAAKLDRRIRQLLNETGTRLFTRKGTKTVGNINRRPLLVLVDRTVDMSTPLHHTWTYQALVHDLFNTELNRVRIVEDGERPKVHLFDLGPNDKFWREQRGTPFPQVAEAVQRELDDYKRQESAAKGPSSLSGGLEDPDGDISLLAETKKLSETLSSVRELREHRKMIENHTTIATSVLDEIKARKLDNFFEIEDKIMNRSPIDKVLFDEIISSQDYGHSSDKFRLFLIAYICDNPSLTDDEAEKYVEILVALGCRRSAFDYVKQWKNFSRGNVANLQSSLQSSGGGLLRSAGMFTKLMSQGSKFVMEGVKNLVLREHHLPLTKIVDGLSDTSSRLSKEAHEYRYLDPMKETNEQQPAKRVNPDAIVFMVGGGNYIEYQNLVDYCKSKCRNAIGPADRRHVIYGATDLMNSNQFVRQLERLGESQEANE